jgi:hypothetical protein
MSFSISPIAPEYLDRIRAQGVDDFGNRLEPTTLEEAGAPLRCCLRDAKAGERVVLIAYRPSSIGGPYAEVGPVFIHAESCEGWSGDSWPAGFAHRHQLLRAYDEAGHQVENIVVAPGEQMAGVEKLLARPEIAFLHSRNLLAGCFMFTVARAHA